MMLPDVHPAEYVHGASVYRLYDENEQLLYVGVTNSPDWRFIEHSDEKPWFPAVAYHELEWFTDRDSALDAEKVAIWEENPVYNIVRPIDHGHVALPSERREGCVHPAKVIDQIVGRRA